MSENQLCGFAAEEGLKHGYQSALRWMQIVWGAGDPFGASWRQAAAGLYAAGGEAEAGEERGDLA